MRGGGAAPRPVPPGAGGAAERGRDPLGGVGNAAPGAPRVKQTERWAFGELKRLAGNTC